MKRDLDLIRTILLRLEASEEREIDPTPPEGCGRERFEYHLEILVDAGYIEVGNLVETYEGKSYLKCRLTWDGQDYLNAVRDSSVWNKVKEEAARLEGVPVAVIKDMAVAAVRTALMGG